jgi:rhodanese-related sulfurtransferase
MPARSGEHRSSARDGLVEAEDLKGRLESGRAVLIDVREPDEHARERIAGARSVPLSKFDCSAVPMDGGSAIVLHCKSGRRSAEALQRLAAEGRSGVLQLRGGIDAWKAAGLPVQTAGAVRLPIMRQVQIVVGAVVLAGSILGWLVSPLFLALTGFFGAGLLFAGLTGTCGMAAALGLMPWNRLGGSSGSCHAGNAGSGRAGAEYRKG